MTIKSPEAKARRKQWLKEYQQRPDVKARRKAQSDARERRPEVRQQRNEYRKQYQKLPHVRVRLAQLQRKSKYGLTETQYDAMLAAQGGRCAICNETPTATLHVDHDHRTGAVRALLCPKHNTMLGLANEDVGILVSAIQYLFRFERT